MRGRRGHCVLPAWSGAGKRSHTGGQRADVLGRGPEHDRHAGILRTAARLGPVPWRVAGGHAVFRLAAAGAAASGRAHRGLFAGRVHLLCRAVLAGVAPRHAPLLILLLRRADDCAGACRAGTPGDRALGRRGQHGGVAQRPAGSLFCRNTKLVIVYPR